MAKKSVGSIQTGSKRLTKAVKMVKSEKTGAYTFVEQIMNPEDVNDFFKKQEITHFTQSRYFHNGFFAF